MLPIFKTRFRAVAICITVAAVVLLTACGGEGESNHDVIISEESSDKVVNLFGPMEKSDPDADNTARTAFDRTVALAEEQLDLMVAYRTYTAENYQEKTYDDVVVERVRSSLDDFYQIGRAHV